MSVTKINESNARKGATTRGHSLGKFGPVAAGNRFATCSRCKLSAFISVIEGDAFSTGGDALRRDCTD